MTSLRSSGDYLPLADIMDGAVAEIEATLRGRRDGGRADRFRRPRPPTNGLHAGQLIIVAARPAIGKALALDTAIPTPTGWSTMGELRAGDQVPAGRPTHRGRGHHRRRMTDRPCYLVEFSDGSNPSPTPSTSGRSRCPASRPQRCARRGNCVPGSVGGTGPPSAHAGSFSGRAPGCRPAHRPVCPGRLARLQRRSRGGARPRGRHVARRP